MKMKPYPYCKGTQLDPCSLRCCLCEGPGEIPNEANSHYQAWANQLSLELCGVCFIGLRLTYG